LPLYHKALLVTDPGINISPNLKQKIKILKNAVRVLSSLGVERPKVACIAPVETVHSKVSSTVDAQALSRMTDEFCGAVVEGPLALDVAISREAAAIKGLSSEVAGDADILLMPEISSANVLYKSLTIFGHGTVAGIAAGLMVPVVLTSRSDTEGTRFLSLRLALSVEP
jgi:phosphotransacetylase